jgi:hypothetical protein
MAPQRQPLDIHLGHVRTLESAGVTPPSEWAAQRQRLLDYLAMEVPVRDQLTAALIAGEHTESIATLRAGALAEAALPNVQAQVNGAVADVIHRQLLDLWAPFASKAFKQVADEFDAAAKLLETAVNICDPELDPEAVVTADEPARAAWLAAPLHAAELDRLVGVLRCAAELCGTNTKSEEIKLALVVDATGAHRRRVWEAWWHKEGRTRRWGALIGAGAVIRAAAVDDLTPYRQPKPIEYKIENRNGLTVTIAVDPEDAPDQAQSQGVSA